MSKGLEALYGLKLSCRQNMDTTPYRNSRWRFNLIEKELTALEIIKNKHVDFHNFHKWLPYGLEQYNDSVWDEEKLIQEEYDLLKEILI